MQVVQVGRRVERGLYKRCYAKWEHCTRGMQGDWLFLQHGMRADRPPRMFLVSECLSASVRGGDGRKLKGRSGGN